MHSLLLQLPSELILHILSFLDLQDLASSAITCRRLRDSAYDDQIWKLVVNSKIARPITTVGTIAFRDLFLAHDPHWFLTENRVWFGDAQPSGKLVLARFNENLHSIEAYTVVAKRGHHTLSFWEKDPDVIIHSFNPIVSLDTTTPVIRIDPQSPRTRNVGNNRPNDRAGQDAKYNEEILMDTFNEQGLFSSFMLCRSLPAVAISTGTSVWPPLRFPAVTRARNDSSDRFQSAGHKPNAFKEISQSNFRIRKWAEYSGRRPSPSMAPGSHSGLAAALGIGMPFFSTSHSARSTTFRLPEDITTYSTLPESCYTPTAAKPWQGIWVGDYSGHGCEFLVITQPDKEDENPLPETMDWLRTWLQRGSRRRSSSASSSASSFVSAMEQLGTEEIENTPKDDEPVGRIEAIKLTGDPNIPRGEYTFIAPDIGSGGLIRIADEETFRGSRIVRSAGHIAGRGFRQDQYTPSQLIMRDHDNLAQYWEGFGHISYYQRVNLDALLDS